MDKASLPAAGARLRPLNKGRLTSSHIARWCAAQENWAKIHYDESYARNVARLPGTLINGALKQHLLAQFLVESFDGQGWVWRIDYQFSGADLVGQALEIRGAVSGVEEHAGLTLVTVTMEICNLDSGRATTAGTGIVVFARSGKPLLDVLGFDLPDGLRLDETVIPAEESLPERIRAAVGQELDRIESDYPLDLSRLRLFADAVMGLRPLHFDPRAASQSPYGKVVASPLFPLHGLDALPGKYPLSEDAEASGREGVTELPRYLAGRFGIAPAGSVNGGSKIEVHSLLAVGERLVGTSQLVAAKLRTGRSGGQMLIFDTINKFSEAGGRAVLSERHSSIYRLSGSLRP